MATNLNFTQYTKEFPYYYAHLADGRKAAIKVTGKLSIEVYGISGKPVQYHSSRAPYHNAFNLDPVMRCIMEAAINNDERAWDYYLYVDSCVSAGIPNYLDRGYFFGLSSFAPKVSALVKLTQKHRGNFEAIRNELQAQVYKKKGLTDAQIEYLAYASNRFNRDTAAFLLDHPTAIDVALAFGGSLEAKLLSRGTIDNLLCEWWKWMQQAEITEIDTTKTFWELAIEARAAKQKIEERVFVQSQLEKALAYENDVFKVLVPTTRDELEAEGEALHNCLNGFEWRNYLCDGNRKVVFIRRKTAPNKPYIACDIHSKSGNIQQYLTYCNGQVQEQDAKDFAKEYQNYLRSLWA